MASQTHIADSDVDVVNIKAKYSTIHQLLMNLQDQTERLTQQGCSMRNSLETVDTSLESIQLPGKVIVHLQEENAILKKQLTEFQFAHMDYLTIRRQHVLDGYRKE